MPIQTTGHFTSAKWEEHAVGAADRRPGLARATVVNTYSGGIQAADTAGGYSIVYLADGTGTFSGLQVISGSLEGREGTFAVEERGTFDAEGALRCTFEVVPGSGTDALAGLCGTGGFVHRHGEESVAYTFDYDLA